MVQKLLALWLISLTACSSVGERPAHVDHATRLAAQEAVTFPAPVVVPARGKAQGLTCNGQEYVAYTLSEAEKELAYKTALKGNSDLAAQASRIVAELEARNRATVAVAQALQDRANWATDAEYDRSVELHREALEHTVDTLLHRLIFILGAVLLI